MSYNQCGCNHWTTPKCPANKCPWQGLRPVDRALKAEAAPIVPQGWKLVPVEPTWDMKIAASTAYREARDGHYTARMEQAVDCYRAMLAASPAPAADGVETNDGGRDA